MTNLNWHGLVAIVLALGLAVAVVLLCLETILHRGPVSDSEAAVLSTVLGAAVGAVATYLGGARPSSAEPPDRSPDTPPAPLSPPPGTATSPAADVDTSRPPDAG